jgi:hypothetical protein
MATKPLMGILERSYQKKAFKIMQRTLLAVGVRIILHEPDWRKSKNWSDEDKILAEALSEMGILYYESAVDDGIPIEVNR